MKFPLLLPFVLLVALILTVRGSVNVKKVKLGGSKSPLLRPSLSSPPHPAPSLPQPADNEDNDDDDEPIEYVYDETSDSHKNDKSWEDAWDLSSKQKRDRLSRKQQQQQQTGCRKKNGEIMSFGPPQFKNAKNLMPSSGANVGHRHDLFCPYRSCPRANITWIKDGDVLVERKRVPGFSSIHMDNRRGKLTIEDNRLEDDGNYTCQISNVFGTIQHTILVKSAIRIVNRKPELKDELENTTVTVGSDLNLTCVPAFEDIATPSSIKWYRHYMVNGRWEDESGVAYAEILQTPNDDPPPWDQKRLELTNLQLNDSSLYSCQIENWFGKAWSTAYISVVEQVEESEINYITIVVVVLILLILTLAFCVACMCKRSRKAVKEKKAAVETLESAVKVTTWVKQVFIEGKNGEIEVKIQKEARCFSDQNAVPSSPYQFPTDSVWEFPRDRLLLLEDLGTGAFGIVKKATARGVIRSGHLQECDEGECVVAVKMVKEQNDQDIIDLVKEIEIMKMIGKHENIINLVGASSQPPGEPLFALVEFACHGNLKDFLMQRKPQTLQYIKHKLLGNFVKTTPDYYLVQNNNLDHVFQDDSLVSLNMMLSFSHQIAKGMEYLAGKKCVHRDLAARNVLVAENYVVKISDFGFARNLEDSDYYRKYSNGRVPIKWMAPESFTHRTSTTLSDVWSYGVLLWEIVTFGDSPYKTIHIDNLATFDAMLKGGFRMAQPPGCPDNLYSVMQHCWNYRPAGRPDWSWLVNTFFSLIKETHPDKYLELSPEALETPPSSPETETRSRIHSRNRVQRSVSDPPPTPSCSETSSGDLEKLGGVMSYGRTEQINYTQVVDVVEGKEALHNPYSINNSINNNNYLEYVTQDKHRDLVLPPSVSSHQDLEEEEEEGGYENDCLIQKSNRPPNVANKRRETAGAGQLGYLPMRPSNRTRSESSCGTNTSSCSNQAVSQLSSIRTSSDSSCDLDSCSNPVVSQLSNIRTSSDSSYYLDSCSKPAVSQLSSIRTGSDSSYYLDSCSNPAVSQLSNIRTRSDSNCAANPAVGQLLLPPSTAVPASRPKKPRPLATVGRPVRKRAAGGIVCTSPPPVSPPVAKLYYDFPLPPPPPTPPPDRRYQQQQQLQQEDCSHDGEVLPTCTIISEKDLQPERRQSKKRGSSESGYDTMRESESSDFRYSLPEKYRHNSESDSVFLRESPSSSIEEHPLEEIQA